jgi:hypothetical protein
LIGLRRTKERSRKVSSGYPPVRPTPRGSQEVTWPPPETQGPAIDVRSVRRIVKDDDRTRLSFHEALPNNAGVDSVGHCSLSPVSGFPGTGRDTRVGTHGPTRRRELHAGRRVEIWRVESIRDDPPPGRASNARRRIHQDPIQDSRADRGETLPRYIAACQQENTTCRVPPLLRPYLKG